MDSRVVKRAENELKTLMVDLGKEKKRVLKELLICMHSALPL